MIPDEPPSFDTSVVHIARVYDYWLGGKDNFAADCKLAKEFMAADPFVTMGVRRNRAFLGRAVHYLAAEVGVRQFLDIGTGIPAADNTHEVAQRAAPDARIVYVDQSQLGLFARPFRTPGRGPHAPGGARSAPCGVKRRVVMILVAESAGLVRRGFPALAGR